MYCVYIHRKASNGEVFYVGKGTSRRPYDNHNRSKFWKSVVAKHGKIVEVVIKDIQEWYAFELEKELISYYGIRRDGGTLINLTYGGEGISGYQHTDSKKRQQSELVSGLKNPRADKTIYEFENIITGEIRKCTRFDMEMFLGKKVADLFKKSLSSTRGWRLKNSHKTTRTDYNIYMFIHKDGREFQGIRIDFKKKYGIDPKLLFSSKKRKSVLGWSLNNNN